MKSIFAKGSNNNVQKTAKFIAPGNLARKNGQKTFKLHGDHNSLKRTSKNQRLRDEGQKSGNSFQNKIGGVSVHTLTLHFGEDEWKEINFTEDSSFLDILDLCRKFVDIYSVGFKVMDGDGKPMKNDRDLLAMIRDHEGLDNIDIYLELDETALPTLFKMPNDHPSFTSPSTIKNPMVKDVSILGENRIQNKIVVHGDVENGLERASTVQLFKTTSKYFDIETDLVPISECTTLKEFQIPFEAIGHFLVAMYTPVASDGKCGEPKYAITEKLIEDSIPQVMKRRRGKNKNKRVGILKSNEKLEIEFFNNRAVGSNHTAWSRHLGKVIRDKNICPIRVKTWKEMTESDKQHMWCSIKECFINPSIELYREHTLEHMCILWTSWRSSLYVRNVKNCKTKTEVLANVPDGMDVGDWEWLVNNKFLSEEFQKISGQNTKNRKNGDMPHRTGSKPHRQVIYEKGGKLTVAEIFYETRQKNGNFAKKEEKDKYDELVEIVNENPSVSQIMMIEKCFGVQQKGNVIGFGGGMKRKYFLDSHVKELENQLKEREEENGNLKRRMDTFESRLSQIENGNQATIHVSSTSKDFVNDVDQVAIL